MDYSVLSLGKALTSRNSVPCGNYTILLVGKLVERTNFTQQQRAKMHIIQGVFLHWASPKKLKYGKPRLGDSTLT